MSSAEAKVALGSVYKFHIDFPTPQHGAICEISWEEGAEQKRETEH